MKIIKVTADDILCQNTYIISNKLSTILIDCGTTISELEKEYIKDTNNQNLPKIDAIFLTHCHFDHICGLEELENKFNCPIYIKSGHKDNLSNKEFNASFLLAKPLLYKPKNIIEIKTEDNITIGNIIIKPIFTPGHSSCSTSYLIKDNLFSGDTLFYLSHGRTDLPGGNSKEIVNSLNKLKNTSYSICFPGHGVPFNKI